MATAPPASRTSATLATTIARVRREGGSQPMSLAPARERVGRRHPACELDRGGQIGHQPRMHALDRHQRGERAHRVGERTRHPKWRDEIYTAVERQLRIGVQTNLAETAHLDGLDI